MRKSNLFALVLAGLLPLSVTANRVAGDTFGSDVNTFEIEFVTIGNPGNAADTGGDPAPDPDPAGSVPYEYRIGKYEISEDMIDKANTLGGLGLTHDNRGTNKPATSLSWFEAAKFVNWLNTSTLNTAAYKFDGNGYGDFQLWEPGDAGYDPNNLYRNSLAKYVLPDVHEWYKAAYYDPSGVYYDYPTGSDTTPTAVATGTAADTAVYDQSFATGPADITLAGGLSPYGTMGQGGNVDEWEETEFDLSSPLRGVRGGFWDLNFSVFLLSSERGGANPTNGISSVGFRVASIDNIPEPTTLALAGLGLLGVACLRRKRL